MILIYNLLVEGSSPLLEYFDFYIFFNLLFMIVKISWNSLNEVEFILICTWDHHGD